MSASNYSERKIERATHEDAAGIVSVLRQNLLYEKSQDDREKAELTGFLLGQFTEEEAKNLIEDTENYIFLTSKENNTIVGYAKGCSVKQLDTDYQNTLRNSAPTLLKVISTEKTFYLQQIAKQNNAEKVGSALLLKLIELIEMQGYQNMVCIIAEKPLQNKTSKAFHEKHGFNCEGYFTAPDQKVFGVYKKKIS